MFFCILQIGSSDTFLLVLAQIRRWNTNHVIQGSAYGPAVTNLASYHDVRNLQLIMFYISESDKAPGSWVQFKRMQTSH